MRRKPKTTKSHTTHTPVAGWAADVLAGYGWVKKISFGIIKVTGGARGTKHVKIAELKKGVFKLACRDVNTVQLVVVYTDGGTKELIEQALGPFVIKKHEAS